MPEIARLKSLRKCDFFDFCMAELILPFRRNPSKTKTPNPLGRYRGMGEFYNNTLCFCFWFTSFGGGDKLLLFNGLGHGPFFVSRDFSIGGRVAKTLSLEGVCLAWTERRAVDAASMAPNENEHVHTMRAG